MPIRGRTPEDCFKTFRDHLTGLLGDVLRDPPFVLLTKGPERLQRILQLGDRSSEYVTLESRSSTKVYFHASQDLVCFRCEDGYQLKTRLYWYKIFDVRPGLEDEPLFRWEYVSKVPSGKHWCRHHFQIGKVSTDGSPRRAVVLPLGDSKLDLNRLHMPTGFVLIEHVLRFLITELDIPSKPDWERAIYASEETFFAKFSARTSGP